MSTLLGVTERIFFLLLVLPLSVGAQWRGLLFEQFDARHGLNSDHIRAICQDKTGYMYFAGYQQLIRYDGRVFEDFTHDPEDNMSIGPGQISKMIVARDGKIWMTMRRDGLNVFDPKTETFQRYAAPVHNNMTDPLAEDAFGNLWFGADDCTLVKFELATGTFTTFQPASGSGPGFHNVTISGIVCDRRDAHILWVTAYDYGSRVDATSEVSYRILRFDMRTGEFEQQPCFGNVKLQDAQGFLWSGSWTDGLFRYEPSSQRCDQMRFEITLSSGSRPGDGVFEIQPVGKAMWLGSRSSVVSVTEDLNYRFVLKDQRIEAVNAIYTDISGITWIGASNGLLALNPGAQHITHYSLSEFGAHERIYPGKLAWHAEDNTIYLISRREPRLYRIPLDTQIAPGYTETSFRLHSVCVTRQGRVLVAAENTLFEFNQRTERLERADITSGGSFEMPSLWVMESHANGVIAAIGHNAFYWFDDTTYALQYISHDDNPLQLTEYSRMFLTDDGHALLSSGASIREINLHNGSERILRGPQYGHVICDREGFYWIGTINHVGQYTLIGDSLHLVRYFTAKDGLTNITATHLHLDLSGRVWIFSSSGMSVIDPVSYVTRNIGVPEGLPVSGMDPVQVINTADGRIATVSGSGVIIFHPDSLWHATSGSDVNIVLKHFRISGSDPGPGQHVNFASHLKLRPDQHTFDIHFQGLAFPNDRHVTYSYMVSGLHDDWIFLGKTNSVTLSRLRPGAYIFRVKAGDPIAQTQVKEIAFTIAAPLYRRTWFIIACAALSIGILYLIYLWRVRQVRRQEAEKTLIHKQMAELELHALRSQMNPHFLFNSLNSIKNYILRNESEKAAEYLSNFSHLIRLILQNSRQKTVSLQEELETLILYIDLEKLRFREGFQFSCQIDDSIDITGIQVPPMIVQPYVENAIWHGLLHKDADRNLGLRIARSNGSVTCEIEDNGIGRERAAAIKSKSAVRYKSMGMGITKDRIALINSMNSLGIRVEVIDKTDNAGMPDGTLVKINIPYAHDTH